MCHLDVQNIRLNLKLCTKLKRYTNRDLYRNVVQDMSRMRPATLVCLCASWAVLTANVWRLIRARATMGMEDQPVTSLALLVNGVGTVNMNARA